MRELRTIPLPLPPAGEGEWGAIQLPWPMTAEQWQAFEAYLPMLKVGFVREAEEGPASAPERTAGSNAGSLTPDALERERAAGQAGQAGGR